MRIIHTADWHLCMQLGRVNRTLDLRAAVERVVAECLKQQADVLLICGDLFDDVVRGEALRQSVDHLRHAFAPFFETGGTVIAIAGNHDNEAMIQTLRQAMALAAPAAARPGDLLPPGRLHLFAGPALFRLADSAGGAGAPPVQFVAMPWPSPSHYLDESLQRFDSLAMRNSALQAAFKRRLAEIQSDPAFDPRLPTVLAAHIMTAGAQLRPHQSMGTTESVILNDQELPTCFAYVALGDVHRPQCLMDLPHVRYSGSIDRLDLGERAEEKSVVLVEIAARGLCGPPILLPLPATPIYRVEISDAAAEMPRLAEKYPDHATALVNLAIRYEPGRDNLNELLAALEKMFPRWYAREFSAAGAPEAPPVSVASGGDFRQVVGDYLEAQLRGHADGAELLKLANAWLAEEGA